MWTAVNILNLLFRGIMYPFRTLNPWIGLVVVSAVTGIVMLAVFGRVSNQNAIRRTRDRMRGYIIELWLFRNDLRLMMSAIGRVLVSNLQYLRYALAPLIFMIIPVVLIMIQLNAWYGYTPLEVGDETTIAVKLPPEAPVLTTEISLRPSEGIRVVGPPLRIPAANEVDWKIRISESQAAGNPDPQHVAFLTPQGVVTKPVAVGKHLKAISPVSSRALTLSFLLHPTDRPLPRNIPIESISIAYPPRRMRLGGWPVEWIWPYFVLAVVAGFGLKGVMGVEI